MFFMIDSGKLAKLTEHTAFPVTSPLQNKSTRVLPAICFYYDAAAVGNIRFALAVSYPNDGPVIL